MDAIIQRLRPTPQGEQYGEIWLAGGCFWGMEKYMLGIHGVVDTDVGYANGNMPNPTYEQVCAHTTGHAETVRVVYDRFSVSLRFVLDLYFKAIDPTSINRQGGDIGEQYRTGIYYVHDEDMAEVEGAINALQLTLDKPVAIEVSPLRSYYLAEDYHQRYLEKNPGGYCHVTDAMCAIARTAREYRKPDDAALRQSLTPLQYRVTQEGETEPPYDNVYNDHYAKGIYVDITTGEPLFASTEKFESNCGWPAFSKPIRRAAISERDDRSMGMRRIEVRSHGGDAHLGHVFDDGPAEKGGLRYCINSAALRFIPKERMAEEGYGELVELVI